jgi:hypothetical protein
MKKINGVLLCASLLFASLLDGAACAAPVNDIALLSASYWNDSGDSTELSESALTALPPYQYIRLAFLSPSATSGLKISVSPQLTDWRKSENIPSTKGKGASCSFSLLSGQSAVITVTGNFDGTDLSREFTIGAQSDVPPPSESVSISAGVSLISEKEISLKLEVGETEVLYYVITGGTGTNRGVAVFASDGDIVAVGQPTGDSVTITARRTGESDVTFMTKESGATAVCRVTVEPAASVIPENDSGGGGCDAGFGAGTLFLAMSLLAARALGFSFRRRSRR